MKNTIYLMLFTSLLWACNYQSHEHTHKDGDDHGHSHSHEGDHIHGGEILDAKVIEATEFAPEYIQHATNIEIIENVATAIENGGVLTHEGSFGPLLFGEELRAFFLDLKPGMFLAEHPHPTESIVYTKSGKWVLCSEGKRQVMEAGSIFHFGSDMPTGWEAPFAEGAYLIIFKKKKEGENYESFTKGTQNLVTMLDKERTNGVEFYFNELDAGHPAIIFAREVNPDFESVLQNIKY